MAPGDKLGKFDLLRQIAVGGMAELYLARTVGIEGFEKLVVVKRILPQLADNANIVNMFLNEARLAATFQHPNIAHVYDIGQEQGDYFFCMEYVHGEDLGRLVASANDSGVPISLDAALTLVAGLCAGLHYAHEKAGPDGKPLNVVHRDVSPSNVLVSYDGAVKLVDFGIARAGSGPSTTRGGLKGKIAYMSPEQCRGRQTLDRRSDVFSIGTILYELTTGRVPFTDETEYGILNQIVNEDAQPPSRFVEGYSRELEEIVMRALARDPEQRYATALEMQRDVEDYAHDNRLRVSPLVLARLMGTLFPSRLEEWDHARAQGAFFVEQHVVRTLIESGKTADTQSTTMREPVSSPIVAPEAEDTTVSGAPDVMTSTHVEDAPTSVRRTPVPDTLRTPVVPRASMPTPTAPSPPPAGMMARGATPHPVVQPPAAPLPPPPVVSRPTPQPVHLPGVHARGSGQQLPNRPVAPVPGLPGAVPIVMPLPPPVAAAGVLVSSSGTHQALVHSVPPVVDVTERVRARTPVASMDTAVIQVGRSRKTPFVILGGLCVVAAVVAIAIVVGGDDAGQVAPAEGMAPAAAASGDEPAAKAAEDQSGAAKAIPPADEKAANVTVTEDKAAQVAEDKAGEAEAAEGKAGEGKAGEGKAGEGKAAEAKVAKDKTAEAKVAEGKAGEGKAGEGKAAEEKAAEKPDKRPVKVVKIAPKPPRPQRVTVAKPKDASKKADKADKVESKSEPNPEPKEQSWNSDSPFMPVRTDKK